MAEANKVSPYSVNDLKNTTDDALGNYLRGLNFKQDNSKLDVRLSVGYVAVVIAAALFVADYKLGWEATKVYTAPAVAAYTILNGIYSYWMWMVEQGLVFEGTRNGKKISIASKTKKHDPTYYVTVTVSSGSSTPSTWHIQTPLTTWFTADGYFVAQPLQKWLASTIDAIGEADPKNAGKDEKAALSSTMSSADSNDAVQATGADAGNTTGSKRSKRKG